MDICSKWESIKFEISKVDLYHAGLNLKIWVSIKSGLVIFEVTINFKIDFKIIFEDL